MTNNSSSLQWMMETEYIQSCNCAYGCPCNFNALPTYGNCEALLGYRVRKGNFGNTKLDDVKFCLGIVVAKSNSYGQWYRQIVCGQKIIGRTSEGN